MSRCRSPKQIDIVVHTYLVHYTIIYISKKPRYKDDKTPALSNLHIQFCAIVVMFHDVSKSNGGNMRGNNNKYALSSDIFLKILHEKF